jgi:hypothetical protein
MSLSVEMRLLTQPMTPEQLALGILTADCLVRSNNRKLSRFRKL